MQLCFLFYFIEMITLVGLCRIDGLDCYNSIVNVSELPDLHLAIDITVLPEFVYITLLAS